MEIKLIEIAKLVYMENYVIYVNDVRIHEIDIKPGKLSLFNDELKRVLDVTEDKYSAELRKGKIKLTNKETGETFRIIARPVDPFVDIEELLKVPPNPAPVVSFRSAPPLV